MRLGNKLFFFVLTFFSLTSFSCKNEKRKPLIIWTDNSEIVSYIELFNSTHKNIRAVAFYKKEPSREIPPAKDEEIPDIVIGSSLKNSSVRKKFFPVDYLFHEKSLDKKLFYAPLLEYGRINGRQYLIPLSFNLPAVIFRKKNESLIGTEHFLDISQMRKLSADFNIQNESGIFQAMGYAPSWNQDFLYLVAKLYGASFHEKGASFVCDEEDLEEAIKEIRAWTKENGGNEAEQNFQFRYLYMPESKQIENDRCLFSFITSDRLFSLSPSQLSDISFRWIKKGEILPVEDSIMTMGIYKKAVHKTQAEVFLSWLMKTETQKLLLERTEKMKLDSITFGIAGGFSALRDVNEQFFPSYYNLLFGNMPNEQYLTLPNILPSRWQSLKLNVVIPYLKDSITQDEKSSITPISKRIEEWMKNLYSD